MNINFKHFVENGYTILPSIIEQKTCIDCLQWLNKQTDKSFQYEPYSKSIFYYSNIIKKNSPFNTILSNNILLSTIKQILDSTFKVYDSVKVYNKPKWCGTVTYHHQEAINNKLIYNNSLINDSVHFFIALEDHNYSCLQIFPKTHKLGILRHYDFLLNCKHKKRIDETVLDTINKTHSCKQCNLKQGDILLFHPLLIHGSNSNVLSKNRKAIAGMFIKQNIVFNQQQMNNNFKKRKEFEKKELLRKLKDYE